MSISRLTHATICLVADGHGRQGVASNIAVEVVVRELAAQVVSGVPCEGIPQIFRDAVLEANTEISSYCIRLGEEESALVDIGSTIVGSVWSHGSEVYITHFGDSRAYLFRGRRLDQLTSDDSLAEALYQAGTISREELTNHRFRTVLWRYLGSSEFRDGREVQVVPIRPGDRILLCTDGLTGVVSDEAICQLLQTEIDAQVCAESLCQAAVDSETRDNVTCVVMDVLNTQSGEEQPISIAYSTAILRLATAVAAGEPCAFALHDALLDAGHPDLAEHFRVPEHLPDCWALQTILAPAAAAVDQR